MNYKPYHESIVAVVGSITVRQESDHAKLQAYAKLAEQTLVPKEHRNNVARVFLRHADNLRALNCTDGCSPIWATIEACMQVSSAMTMQAAKVMTAR